jgi:GDP-4-dehydro-6-deoxy-D-mannose reductase
MTSARVLVTGATGFLGAHAAAALQAAGAQVAGLVRREPAPAPAWEVVVGDLARAETLACAVGAFRPQVVVHCAAYGVDWRQQDPLMALRINTEGTLALAIAARNAGATRFVHVGTAFEYGHSDGLLAEDAPLRPRGIYGASKAAGSLVLQEAALPGLQRVLVRPFGMFGLGEGPHKLLPQVVRACVAGEALAMTEGAEWRDYAPVSWVARALALLALAPVDAALPPVVNLCSGEALRVRDVAHRVATCLGGAHLLRPGTLPSRGLGLARVVGNPGAWQALAARLGEPSLCEPPPWEPTVLAMAADVGRMP